MKNKQFVKLLKQYLNRESSLLKVEFDGIFFEAGDKINSGIGSQEFYIRSSEGPIVWMEPVFDEDHLTLNSSSIYPGVKFYLASRVVGEFDSLSTKPQKVKELNPTTEVYETKKGVKIVLKTRTVLK